eukprot:Skav207942  [mRNA]  locus=scaffold108:230058:230516:+ [translate_table: standard]
MFQRDGDRAGKGLSTIGNTPQATHGSNRETTALGATVVLDKAMSSSLLLLRGPEAAEEEKPKASILAAVTAAAVEDWAPGKVAAKAKKRKAGEKNCCFMSFFDSFTLRVETIYPHLPLVDRQVVAQGLLLLSVPLLFISVCSYCALSSLWSL